MEVTTAGTVAGGPDAEENTDHTGVTIDLEVNDGDIVSVGAARLGVIRLTGHTPGSIALVYEPEGVPAHIFTGDSLFPGGVGNTFGEDRKSTRLNSSHVAISYAVFCLK